MNSAHGPCACAARSRSNATSCSAWWHSRSIKYSASRNSGLRRPERRPLRPTNTGKFAAFDEFCKRLHGNSMSLYWTLPAPVVGVCPKYLADVPENTGIMSETAQHIATIQDSEIERIVKRIPDGYLPAPKRTVIIKNL